MKTRLQPILRTAFLLLVLLISSFTAMAYDFVVNGIYYNKNDDGISVSVTSKNYLTGNDYSGHVTIPASVSYQGKSYTVTRIDSYSFRKCSSLTGVEFPVSLKIIESNAFSNCTRLTSINIPNSVTYLGGFTECTGLTSVTIGNSVVTIGGSAFQGCKNLNSVILPNSVKEIEGWAFYGCSELTSFTIPNNVTAIGEGAFYNCEKLSSISIPNSVVLIGRICFANTPWIYNQPNGVVYAGKVAIGYNGRLPNDSIVTLAEGTLGIASEAFRMDWDMKGLNIPNTVIAIGDEAFSNCFGLTNVIIPNSVTILGNKIFKDCSNLTSVTIGKSILSIPEGEFEGCSRLKKLYYNAENCNDFDSGMNHPFYGCPIEEVIIGNDVNRLPAHFVHGNKNLKTISIPNSVISIGISAFDNTELISVELPNSITRIEKRTFAASPIRSITIPNSVTYIDEEAFYATYLYSIIIPESVTYIGKQAFGQCSYLKSIIVDDENMYYDSRDNCNAIIETETNKLVTGCWNSQIPNTVQEISDWAFYGINMASVILPNSVRSIGEYAFANGYLSSINCLSSNPPTIKNQNTFENYTYQNAILSVPYGSLDSYSQASYWSLFKHYREKTEGCFDSEINIRQIGPTSLAFQVNETVKSVIFQLNGVVIGHDLIITGLEPSRTYNSLCELETVKGKIKAIDSYTTLALRMTAKAADMITNKDARLMAETNMADVETSCGFEWRRYDAPEEMPSAKVYCPVYGGVMAGTLKNLSENVYYKYRPFYKSSAGNEYYGDWVAFITADAGVEFEPVVYTYDAPAVTQTEATLQGVALRGSEEITEQGFEYWPASKANTLTASNNVTRVTANGERMSKTVTGLQAGTKYKFRAYVIAGGETTNGAEVEFVTLSSSLDVNLDGEVNIADVNSVIDLIMDNDSIGTGDVNGDGEVNIADINTLIDAILSK